MVTATPTSTPQPSPSAPPVASGSPAFTVLVPLDANHEEQVAAYDPGFLLTGARSSTTSERLLVEPDMLGLDAGLAQGRSDREVVVLWVGTICDRDASVTIDESRIQIVDGSRPACDAMAVGRAVTLEFARPTKASALTVDYVAGPIVQ